eukprot:TRINITY_DN1125_c0_g1_i1.p1 TRINITY_DN1125_c0_g1~~TRINITY_DN1125_c0_g1_i1.p1  ORF type:complete len:371 (-),score=65.93 TRINITY_DN1125_c0_g1_i1:102-1214(-)
MSWRKHIVIAVSPYPSVNIDAITSYFPPVGGFTIKIKGTKPDNIKVEQALLYLQGNTDSGADAFWSALNRIFGSKSLSMGKITMYPVKLVPNHIYCTSLNGISKNVEFTIYIPAVMTMFGNSVNIKRSMLEGTFQKIIAEGDPEVEFIVDYTSRPIKEGSYKKHGTIVRFKTKFSSILSADQTGSLDCTTMDNQGNWAVPQDNFKTTDSTIDIKEKEKDKDKEKEKEKDDNDDLFTSFVVSRKDTMQPLEDKSEDSDDQRITVQPVDLKKSNKLKLSSKLKKSATTVTVVNANKPDGEDEVNIDMNTIDTKDISELVSMGFEKEKVIQALAAYPGNKEGAINYLILLSDDIQPSSLVDDQFQPSSLVDDQ